MKSLTVAVLTGKRPQLLERTLSSFVERNPLLWKDASRVVFHNFGDGASARILDRYDWHKREVRPNELLTIGQASQYLGALALSQRTRYVLRLEDDWLCHDSPGWFESAVNVLEDPEVGQVRLQRHDEPTRPENMVTHEPIVWSDYPGGHQAGNAHYTHRPSLMRSFDYSALFPYRKEHHAMRRFYQRGLLVVQHRPGVFSHLGGDTLSLKRREGAS